MDTTQQTMISSARPDDPHFTTPIGGVMLYVVTDDPDAVHTRAKGAGAAVTRPMEDADYRVTRLQHPRPGGQLVELRHVRRVT
ncbi:VOC family protein [Janibacter cremeus]|uniref:Putative glyoxalase superfamily protein PhnB n=1 Tax=Janibacter cremeus TaxID=1285192 RepID=A0A852W097_9MICO|nr:hypothetical protein [Janibacter cremeus]NYF99405.1 putative glyoxalase superfamily protein PhnB [Janibacter cremeus]